MKKTEEFVPQPTRPRINTMITKPKPAIKIPKLKIETINLDEPKMQKSHTTRNLARPTKLKESESTKNINIKPPSKIPETARN